MQSRTAGLGGSGQSQVGLLSEEGALARGGGGVCGFRAVRGGRGGVGGGGALGGVGGSGDGGVGGDARGGVGGSGDRWRCWWCLSWW